MKLKVLSISLFICLSFFQIANNNIAFGDAPLIGNASFEQSTNGTPDGWDTTASGEDVLFEVLDSDAQNGSKCVSITNNSPSDSRYHYNDIFVERGKIYKASCWVKTENVDTKLKGANITIGKVLDTSIDITGTNGKWEQLDFYIKIGSDIETISLCLALGGVFNETKGKAYFDNVTFEEVQIIPEGSNFTYLSNEINNTSNNDNNGQSSNKLNTFSIFLVGFFAGLVFFLLLLYFLKNKQQNSQFKLSSTGNPVKNSTKKEGNIKSVNTNDDFESDD